MLIIGGSKGGRQGRAPPPGGPNSFIFMQFSAKSWKNNPTLGVGAPPQENPGSATVDSHILMVLRRIIAIYITWMISGIGFFIYLTYYPILLNEPILNLQFHLFGEYLYNR